MRLLSLMVIMVLSAGALAGCRRPPPVAPSPADVLVATFKPGRVEKVGEMTWSARAIKRVDQFTLAYDDVKLSRAEPTGEVIYTSCRRMVVRFQPKGWFQMELEDVRMETNRSRATITSERLVLPPVQMPDVAPSP